jgi:hypothetical protein
MIDIRIEEESGRKREIPEPIDEKGDAQAFAGLVLVIAVKLWQLSN